MAEVAPPDRSDVPTAQTERVIFTHIPKTGGTTLNFVLHSNARAVARLGNVFKGGGGRAKEPDYERMAAKVRTNDSARLFWGHTPFAIADHIPPDLEVHFITFLRDPVERSLSQYYGMLARLDGNTDTEDSDEEEEAVRRSSRKEGVIRDEFSRDVPYDIALTNLAFVADNLQTRMLCGLPEPFGDVTEEMLEMAVENLRRFRCVGLTERFDESLVLLKHRIGYESILHHDRRVNSTRPRGADVPEGLRSAAEQANTFDQALYRHAVALFDTSPELGEPDFRLDLAAVRSATTGGRTPTSDEAESVDADGRSWTELVAGRRAHLEQLLAETQAERRAAIRVDRQAARRASEAPRPPSEPPRRRSEPRTRERAAKHAPTTERAVEWLTTALPAGASRSVHELTAEAAEAGFTFPELDQARRRLKPACRRVPTETGEHWTMKAPDAIKRRRRDRSSPEA